MGNAGKRSTGLNFFQETRFALVGRAPQSAKVWCVAMLRSKDARVLRRPLFGLRPAHLAPSLAGKRTQTCAGCCPNRASSRRVISSRHLSLCRHKNPKCTLTSSNILLIIKQTTMKFAAALATTVLAFALESGAEVAPLRGSSVRSGLHTYRPFNA